MLSVFCLILRKHWHSLLIGIAVNHCWKPEFLLLNFQNLCQQKQQQSSYRYQHLREGKDNSRIFQLLHPILHHYTSTIINAICPDAVSITPHSKSCLVKPDYIYLRSGFTLCGPSVAIALKHKRKLKLVSKHSHCFLTASSSCEVTCSGICFYMQVYTCIYMQKTQ